MQRNNNAFLPRTLSRTPFFKAVVLTDVQNDRFHSNKDFTSGAAGGDVANFSVSSQVCLHIHTGVRLKDAPSNMLSIIRRSAIAKTLVVLEMRLQYDMHY